jgi:poly-beta-1,6-N-acetyl-D-glucosamine synthase
LIPAYNEELVIEGTIQALLEAKCKKQDIYIVDDRSTDKTAEIARSCGVNVYTVPENGGKARAQTAALKHFGLCEGPLAYDWIIFLDGDSKVESGFYEAIQKAIIKKPNTSLFVGQVKSVKNNHIYSAYRGFEYTFSHDLAKKAQNNFNVIYVSPGCASCYRVDVLKKLNIDHETLAEDMDLTIQVHRLGGGVEYIEEAGVMTQDPNNFKDYHKQVLRWYRGFWQVVKKHNILWWGKKNWVDLYILMIIADAVFMNRLVYLIGLMMLFPNISGVAIFVDIALAFIVSCYCGWKTKRADVVWKFPMYYWLSYFNFYALVRSFLEIIVFRKEILAWNKVARYEFNDTTLLAKEIK